MYLTVEHEDIGTSLNFFAGSVNGNSRMAPLLKGWEPVVLVEESDSGQLYTFKVVGGRVQSATAVDADDAQLPHTIRLRGSQATLCGVFTGKLNPAAAYVKGALEVYGSTADQVKLDVICLVLWGL